MDAKTFLAEFGHIASASGGVQRLREMVRMLAISGQLIESRSTDKPDDLIAEIDEKGREAQLTRKSRRSFVSGTSQIDLFVRSPSHWMNARLADLGEIVGGGTPPSEDILCFSTSEEDLVWLTPSDLYGNRKKYVASSRRRLTERGLASCSAQRMPPGTILFSSRAPIGYLAIARCELATNQGFKSVVPFVKKMSEYIYLYLSAIVGFIEQRASGTTFKEISGKVMANLPISFPSLSEQQNIVAKVDELMALCDKLEAQQQRRDRLSQQTRNAVFDCLATNGQTPDELVIAWRRVESNAAVLIDSPESIQSYKGAILDLALSGLLLPPRSTASTTGQELLACIDDARNRWAKSTLGQEQKEALAMQRKVRSQRVKAPDTSLPLHWTWGSLLQVAQAVVDCHNKTAPYVPEGIHLVRTTDIRDGQMNLSHTRKVSRETYEYWARRLPPKAGDIFFTREAPMGEAAIVPEGETVCLGQRTMLIRLFPELFSNRFLLYVIRSPGFQKRMIEASIGMTVKHLRVGGVEDLIVPVPPKEEQDRIVEVIDALFSHCDRLADQLARKQQTAANLAQASVAAITGIRSEENTPMKAPKTELISKLQLNTTSPEAKDTAPLAALLARHKGEMSAKALWRASGLEIDAFYQQLKAEMASNWIVQPEVASVREVETN